MRQPLYLLSLFSFLCITAAGNPSSDSVTGRNYYYISAYYQLGKVMSTNKFLKGENYAGEPIRSSQSLAVEFGKQTSGNKEWQQLYGYPKIGAGLSVLDFSYARETGIPITLYGFFNAPFIRWRAASLNFNIGMGMTSNWKPYTSGNNPWNIAVGSLVTAYIDLGSDLSWAVSNHLDFNVGIHFIHSSNGGVTLPNAGINQVGLRMALSYNFSPQRPVFIKQEIGKFVKTWEWLAQAGWGPKQITCDTIARVNKNYSNKVNYNVFILRSAVLRQVSHKVKLGMGVDLTYKGSNSILIAWENGKAVKQTVPLRENLLLSGYGSVELVIDRLGIALQPGFYLIRTETYNSSPAFYQQLDIKYHLFKSGNFFVGLALRAYKFQVADFIEWNLGYRIRWKS